MTASANISDFLKERIDAGDFPSAVYLVAEKGEIVLQDALGYAVVEPERFEARLDTIYDLASVTKVLVTGLLAAKLVEDGRLDLDTRVNDILPGDKGELGGVTVKQLATHTSGLPGWLPFYLLVAERENIFDELAGRPLAERSVVYGDPNFWVLTFIIERIFGESITETAERLIVEPLGLKDTAYCPPASELRRVAASENGTAFERQLCREFGFEVENNRVTGVSGFRDGQIWGEVHDQNAWFFGNVCGHAGLFSTASEVLTIARQFLPAYTKMLRSETCDLFTMNYTPGPNEHRSFCFELASSQNTTAGSKMPPQSFGHNGFTGTSLWIDPGNERVFVLLTNRTHNRDLPLANINRVRRRFHDLAIEYLDRK